MKEANRDVLDRGSLPELLAHRARNASDQRLVIDAAAGLVVAAIVVALRPPLWVPLAALAFALGAFGTWGILDREATDASPGGRQRLFSAARGAVALLGAAAAAVSAVSLFFAVLGQWIS
jgi:hypothetical protein